MSCTCKWGWVNTYTRKTSLPWKTTSEFLAIIWAWTKTTGFEMGLNLYINSCGKILVSHPAKLGAPFYLKNSNRNPSIYVSSNADLWHRWKIYDYTRQAYIWHLLCKVLFKFTFYVRTGFSPYLPAECLPIEWFNTKRIIKFVSWALRVSKMDLDSRKWHNKRPF